MKPAGLTAGIVDFGRSGEFQLRWVVAVGDGTGGLLMTTPDVDVALADVVGVDVAVGVGEVDATAGPANSFCTEPLANATTMISERTSSDATPMMTPVCDRFGGVGPPDLGATPYEGACGCGRYGCCWPYGLAPGLGWPPGTTPYDCSEPFAARWLGAEGGCGTNGFG